MEILQMILGGAVGSSIVVGLFGLITWKLNRKAAKEDKAEDREEEKKKRADSEMEEINAKLENLTIALRTQMYNLIKKDGKSYLARGSITSEELEDLIDSHRVYHDVLKGNGFLDSLMDKVKRLPVKN